LGAPAAAAPEMVLAGRVNSARVAKARAGRRKVFIDEVAECPEDVGRSRLISKFLAIDKPGHDNLRWAPA
jgi:hypothetical protein